MKAILFFHSNSGQTRRVCDYLCRQLPGIEWTLADMRQPVPADLGGYALAGFATWTYYMGIPPLVLDFIQSLPVQGHTPAFVLTTFGMMAGQGLKCLEQAVRTRGFIPVDGFSLHTPENYPPFVLKGQSWDSPNAPEPAAIQDFGTFINRLKNRVGNPGMQTTPIRIGFWNSLMRPSPLKKVQKDMGPLKVDRTLCDGCGICQPACAYGAVKMDGISPVFNPSACQACWNCFNQCPKKAISTVKVGAGGQFAGLSTEFMQKLPL
jgi:NAD-dependent dihydropyrimidine dehydrogenase PreA subunit/flavodoxin